VVISTIQRLYATLRGEELDEEIDDWPPQELIGRSQHPSIGWLYQVEGELGSADQRSASCFPTQASTILKSRSRRSSQP